MLSRRYEKTFRIIRLLRDGILPVLVPLSKKTNKLQTGASSPPFGRYESWIYLILASVCIISCALGLDLSLGRYKFTGPAIKQLCGDFMTLHNKLQVSKQLTTGNGWGNGPMAYTLS